VVDDLAHVLDPLVVEEALDLGAREVPPDDILEPRGFPVDEAVSGAGEGHKSLVVVVTFELGSEPGLGAVSEPKMPPTTQATMSAWWRRTKTWELCTR
jgi:hypothetical protein